MDIHNTNYTLCAMESVIGEGDRIFANIQVTPDYKNIINKRKMELSSSYIYQLLYQTLKHKLLNGKASDGHEIRFSYKIWAAAF